MYMYKFMWYKQKKVWKDVHQTIMNYGSYNRELERGKGAQNFWSETNTLIVSFYFA